MVSVDGVKVILKKKKKVRGSAPDAGEEGTGKVGVGCLVLLGRSLDRILPRLGNGLPRAAMVLRGRSCGRQTRWRPVASSAQWLHVLASLHFVAWTFQS